MLPQTKPSCSMNSSELGKASQDHLAFTERLLESVRARRDSDAKETASVKSGAADFTPAGCSYQQHSMVTWVFQIERT